MSTVERPTTETAEDPFRLGWRYVKVVGPGGEETLEQVPLTEDDVLHPQEGDFIVQNEAHDVAIHYLRAVLRSQAQAREGLRVYCDHRVDWEVEGIRAHGPDLVVFDGGEEHNPKAGTFYVGQRQARPLLVVEVTSPTTRDNDLGVKVEHYYKVGIPVYLIVDQGTDLGRVRWQLVGYRAGPDGYERIPPDAKGRLPVEPVGLLIHTDGDQVVCEEETGERIGDYNEISLRMKTAESRLVVESAAREEAERARQVAEEKADREAAERALTEQARKDAEERAAREAAERAAAEERAKAEKAAYDLRVKELEEELRRLRGAG